MTGSNDLSRSRGTSTSTGPTPVNAVFDLVPLGMFAATGFWPCQCPGCSASPASGGFQHVLRKLIWYSAKTDQAHTRFLGLREQSSASSFWSMISSATGSITIPVMSDQAGPHRPFI